VLAAARDRDWEQPVATANGEMLLVPHFSTWTLYDSIEEWLAARRDPKDGPAPDPDEIDLRDYGTD
jgi:hypothetical protein